MSVFAKVVTFSKSTVAAPSTQSVTGVGFTPKAVILWTAGGIVDGSIRGSSSGDCRTFIGIATSASSGQQFVHSNTADTGTGGGRRLSQRVAQLLDSFGNTVVSEASLSAFTSDGFNLTWSTNSTSEAQVIHALCLGGADLQAKALPILSTSSSGTFSTTGAGFQPNALFSPGLIASNAAFDTAFTIVSWSLGGGVSSASRWAASAASFNIVSAKAFRQHRNDRFIQEVNSVDGTSTAEMDIASLDADGFTLNKIVAGSVRFGVLALRVPKVAAGAFTKPTGAAPAAGSVNFGFTPVAVLVVGDMDINRSNASSQTGTRMGLSAFTSGTAAASVISVPDVPNPLTFAGLDKSSKAATKINNATPAIDAEATGVIDSNGFTATWNANDAVATEWSYLALGDTPVMLYPIVRGVPSPPRWDPRRGREVRVPRRRRT